MVAPVRHAQAGFTLIEVLVALLIMSIMAVIGWRGIDSMVRSRDITQAASDRSLLLSKVIGQWEQDLQALQASPTLPDSGLAFDGASLRLTRRSEGGVQLVVWSLHSGVWQRWAAPVSARVADLQEAWLRSQQLQGSEPEQLRLLSDVPSWQLYFYRGGWSNPQSTGNLALPAAGATAAGGQSGTAAGAGAAALPPQQQLPTGVRLVIELPEGTLTRDVLLRTS